MIKTPGIEVAIFGHTVHSCYNDTEYLVIYYRSMHTIDVKELSKFSKIFLDIICSYVVCDRKRDLVVK